ncbi:MAG: TIM barrel protein [Candidatus Bathyarchaeia archaeon]
MRVGIHAWEADAEKLAAYCHSIDVEDVCLSCSSVEGFDETGILEASALRRFKQGLSWKGVDLTALIAPTPSRAVLEGNLDGGDEAERLCKTIEAMGEAEVNTALWYPFNGILYRPPHLIIGEGGRYSLESLDGSFRPGGLHWPTLVSFFRRIAEAAEGAGVKLASHMWDLYFMDALLEAVASRSMGVTYCPGIYILGGDPYDAIAYLGADRVFLAHARNVVRHGPRFRDYEEVFLDKGDVDISRCIQLLKSIGYEGIIIPEHLGPPSDEANLPNAVRYLKGTLTSREK